MVAESFNLFKFVAMTGGTTITTRCPVDRCTRIWMRWDHTEIIFDVSDRAVQNAGSAAEMANVVDRKALEAIIKHVSSKQIAADSQRLLTMASRS